MLRLSKIFIQNCTAIFSLLLVAQLAAAATTDRGLIWQAEKNNQSIVLLGSVHLANKSFYPLPNKIEESYKNSDALVVEADILAMESDPALLQQVMTESLYGPGESLRDHVSPEVYTQLINWLRQRNLPEQMIIRQRPAIAMMTLSMLELQAQGLDSNLGIDRHFLMAAHKSAKPVLELESVLGQLRLLNSLKNPGLYLQQTLEELSDVKAFVPKLTSSWKSGDAAGFYRLTIADTLKDHPEYKPLYEILFFKRNKQMAEKLLQFSKAHSKLFAVVGAGHLVGERSVITYLQQQGFKVQQL